MGLRTAGKYYWAAASDLLVGPGLGSKSSILAEWTLATLGIRSNSHLSDHALESDVAAGTLSSQAGSGEYSWIGAVRE